MTHFRSATAADAEEVADVLAQAFATDPLWGPTLARPDGSTAHLARYWGFFVRAALRTPWVTISSADGVGVDAVAVWVPPGETELEDDEVAELLDLVDEELPGLREVLLELFARFEATHPHEEPHYYLSLLATRDAARGRGLGMELLRHDLARMDAERVPSYLESSNPGNDTRYGSVGYVAVGSFTHPTTGAVVTAMWRPVGG